MSTTTDYPAFEFSYTANNSAISNTYGSILYKNVFKIQLALDASNYNPSKNYKLVFET
jgi:hypothetical protein